MNRRFLLMHRTDEASCRHAGFSLVELVVTVAVVGILAAILIPQTVGVGAAAERSMVQSKLNALNAAVGAFNQSSRRMGDLVTGSATNKEQAVLMWLYAYDPDDPIPGSPFLDPDTPLSISSQTNKMRASWNGRVFELIERGSSGAGVDLD